MVDECASHISEVEGAKRSLAPVEQQHDCEIVREKENTCASHCHYTRRNFRNMYTSIHGLGFDRAVVQKVNWVY